MRDCPDIPESLGSEALSTRLTLMVARARQGELGAVVCLRALGLSRCVGVEADVFWRTFLRAATGVVEPNVDAGLGAWGDGEGESKLVTKESGGKRSCSGWEARPKMSGGAEANMSPEAAWA